MNSIVLYLKSGYLIFDEEDFDLVCSYNWRVNNLGYVTYQEYTPGITKPKTLLLHRLILGVTGRYEVVDHINHNPQDNRRCNIRKASIGQNVWNTVSYKNSTSKYLGVSFETGRKKWRAQIKANGKQCSLGRFNNETDAALAYNEAASRYFGEFANLNVL